MNPVMGSSIPAGPTETTDRAGRLMLWIDGVGGYLACLGNRVTLGGPSVSGNGADISLLANLSRRHATFIRTEGGYLLEPHAALSISGRTVQERTPLNTGYEIKLGSDVQLRFLQPTVLSASAVLDFESEHRPSHSVDGVILMDDTCLLGPGSGNHVRCRDWTETVVLYRRGDRLHCRSRADLFREGVALHPDDPLNSGDVVTGPDLRFRIEELG